MREIKFRGKRTDNGEWVYGNFVQNKDGTCYIKDTDYNVNNGRIDIIPALVDPDTVGQYIGLKDKNGKEIYEGDLVMLGHWVSTDLFDYLKPFTVAWEFGQTNFKQCGFNNFIGSLNGRLIIEVIGNIYEHPELLHP